MNGQAIKGARRMPWHWEPKKDVVSCEKRVGGVAQLGEHLPCKQGVRGSIPLISTRRGLIAQVVRAHA